MTTDYENPIRHLPDEDLTVYTAYGLAMFTAATVERGLINALAHHRIGLARQEKRVLGTNPWNKAASSSFQNLVAKVTPLCGSDPELPTDLTNAVKRRNYLAHSFWYDKAPEMMADGPRGRLVAELADDIDAFYILNDRVAVAVANPGMEALGASIEASEALHEKLLRDAQQAD
ncbi:hypothetical protein ABZS72_16240 [Streptomyces albidoflavus]|uniref:hypothetical protein n=1 Tax=Streptomyces albidoflavus TaxID=1886 RepID=UPI0033A0383C